MEKRRVVITGMGVVAPNGIGVDAFWDSLVHGRSAVRRITHFDASSYPCKIAAEVPEFDPTDYMDPKTAKRLSRFAQFALSSAKMAIEDSYLNLSQENPSRIGVFIGTAIGGGDIIENQTAIFFEKGFKRVSPFSAVSISTHSASGIISCVYNLKGPNTTISAGCNSGLDACYLAYNAIRLGDADIVVVGSGEAPIIPCTFAVFCASGNLSRENTNPHKAVKPYDIYADGMVLGEGGAIIILEELRHALKRGAKIYGEFLGYASANEAFDLFGIDSNDGTMAINFNNALMNAQLLKNDIDYINAHGNGILKYDINETLSIKKAFGEFANSIPITTIKPVTGHAISTTGLWQVISSLLSIQTNIIPPTLNLTHPDENCDLHYVTKGSIKKEIKNVLVNAHGFGGRLTTLILKKFESSGI